MPSRPGFQALNLLVAAALLLPGYLVFWNSLWGDAAIYFNYFLRFFDLPFSFQPGTVSFGATSPLHVVFMAPVFHVFHQGWFWLDAIRVFGLALLAVAVVLLGSVAGRGLSGLIPIAVLVGLDRPLIYSSAQGFETPLAFLYISILVYLAWKGLCGWAVGAAGAACLVRPELIVSGFILQLLLIHRSRKKLRIIPLLVASYIPAAAYQAWMFFHTGRFFPSSLVGRHISFTEGGGPWIDSLAATLGSLVSRDGFVFILGIVCLGAVAMSGKLKGSRLCDFAVLSFLACFVIVPPGEKIVRYIQPAVPVLVLRAEEVIWRMGVCSGRVARRLVPGLQRFGRTSGHAFLAPLLLLAVPWHVRDSLLARHLEFDLDVLLLKDLSDVMEALPADPDAAILLYEIQGQFNLPGPCISMDGIVGGEAIDFLRGRQSFREMIEENGIGYVVTANAMSYRSIYRGTPLQELYEFDLESDVGEQMTADGIRFTKLTSNPWFSDDRLFAVAACEGLNSGDSIRVVGPGGGVWSGLSPMWNSVFSVEIIEREGSTPDGAFSRAAPEHQGHGLQ